MGVSTPRVECWGSAQKRRAWSLQETPVVDERPGLIYDAHARAAAFSGACERRMAASGILEHLSSAYAARDMLAVLEGTGHRALRYWGISYGSILGGVFAGLYPDRVERLVSDGECPTPCVLSYVLCHAKSTTKRGPSSLVKNCHCAC